jgi:hypothetical protein
MIQESKYSLLVLIIALGLPALSFGQISVTSGSGQTYSQNFDYDGVSPTTNGLTRNLGVETWVNNVDTVSTSPNQGLIGMTGWYLGAYTNATDLSITYAPTIRANNGASGGGFSSHATTSTTLDKALGSAPFDSQTGPVAGSFRIGTRFVNDTGLTISGFTFSYDGEQWRIGNSTAVNNQLTVSYAVFAPGAGSLQSVAYSADMPGATFDSPIDSGTVGSLNGNDPLNRVAGLGATITGLTVAPGDEIWLRWFDLNNSGGDHGMAIDNFTISFAVVPEPSTVALLGVGLAALVVLRRRTTV